MNIASHVGNSGDEKWSQACLRISGDTLRPDAISAALGLEPTQSGVKGERFSSRHNAVRRTSFWLLSSSLSANLPLEEHLRWLLDTFEPKSDAIHTLAETWQVEFFCGFSSGHGQGGAIFEAPLLRRLADLGVSFVLNLYPPEGCLDSDEEPQPQGSM